mmetsp:Transcript_109651/g.217738  ORF Transcript_109651/g.217738 Transcript_109651/m.217738 type:complete len:96 (+) Transcript_109651:903-1190(+)
MPAVQIIHSGRKGPVNQRQNTMQFRDLVIQRGDGPKSATQRALIQIFLFVELANRVGSDVVTAQGVRPHWHLMASMCEKTQHGGGMEVVERRSAC